MWRDTTVLLGGDIASADTVGLRPLRLPRPADDPEKDGSNEKEEDDDPLSFSPKPMLEASNIPHGVAPFESWTSLDRLEDMFLRPKAAVPLEDLPKWQCFWEKEPDLSSLARMEPFASTSELEVEYDCRTGLVNGINEISVQSRPGKASSSSSLLREPVGRNDFVRGKTTNKPFAPGGEEYEAFDSKAHNGRRAESDQLLTVPLGFRRGGTFPDDDAEFSAALSSLLVGSGTKSEDAKALELPRIANANHPKSSLTDAQKEEAPSKKEPSQQPSTTTSSEADAIVDSLPVSAAQPKKIVYELKPKESHSKLAWAVEVDVKDPFDAFHQEVPNMAFQYPFELDTFQRQAIFHLEKGDSVFVAAHTSAGKTVVAEYAIALARKRMTRAIYTSPIKALSNQKYRDFVNTFDNVGLLTGDVQINAEASCLIMTTEILRSMLYRGADLIRDVEYVIFDEVHYINDLERGVVWEEVIIMLPSHVQYIFLSATVPNTMEFADWIGRTKQKKVYVISTTHRPVPLEYHLYYNKTLFPIVDSKRKFLMEGYNKAFEVVTKGNSSSKSKKGSLAPTSFHSFESQEKTQVIGLIDFLKKQSLMPTVFFVFSRKRCETLAAGLNNVDLATASEKSQVHVFMKRSLQRLKGSDQELPQILRLGALLARGIAVHHSGLLPILKEMVEILFARGLVKVLFATETFAMGVNMPARCVVFHALRKHDGNSMRDLLPGEFTQMAGRAGRRGKDTVGTVLIMITENLPDTETLSKVTLGLPTKLESKFRLTYGMILNLLRVEELRVEDMIRRSFSEFRDQKNIPEYRSVIKTNKEKLEVLSDFSCSICAADIQSYYRTTSQALQLGGQIHEEIASHPAGLKYLASGRVLVVNTPTFRNCVAVILHQNVTGSAPVSQSVQKKSFTCFVACEGQQKSSLQVPMIEARVPAAAAATGAVAEVSTFEIWTVTKSKIKVEPRKLLGTVMDETEKASVIRQLIQVAQQPLEGVNPIKEFRMQGLEFSESYHRFMDLRGALATGNYECLRCPDLATHYGQWHERMALEEKIAELNVRLSDRNLTLLPDYERRVDVLKRLRYVDENSTVQLKGRVACEINTCDEVLLTELILDNVFADMDATELVALLSAFVFQEKAASEPNLTEKLSKGKEAMLATAESIAVVQHECGLSVAVEDYMQQLKFGLVEVVYEWARGTSFKQITELTDVLEGSIVRCIVRLDETCRDLRNAARVIGDSSLYETAEKASILIKRDIVFAASLYY